MSHTFQHALDSPRICRTHATQSRWLPKLQQIVTRSAHKVHGRIERSRQCQALGRHDNRLLDDIDVSRRQALRESRKQFWQAYGRRHLR